MDKTLPLTWRLGYFIAGLIPGRLLLWLYRNDPIVRRYVPVDLRKEDV